MTNEKGVIAMAWKNAGAVERGVTPRPTKDLAEGAGENAALTDNGYFQRFPHPVSPDLRAAFFAIAVLGGAALTYIAVATVLKHNAPPAPRPHVCVHPTSMPATWFGDCGAPRFGGQR